jgi:hypothetical protein
MPMGAARRAMCLFDNTLLANVLPFWKLAASMG